MGCLQPAKAMPLHRAGETLPDAGPHDVDSLARNEMTGQDFVAEVAGATRIVPREVVDDDERDRVATRDVAADELNRISVDIMSN